MRKARDVGFEPTRPFDHRLSRPAPYQAWGIPPQSFREVIQDNLVAFLFFALTAKYDAF